MTRAQRIVAILYCLLVVYCCVWVPWYVNFSTTKHVRLGYEWLWSGPPYGSLDMAAITLRLGAATALGIAAFVLARKWKALLSATILVAVAFAGILLYTYWTDKVAERRAQKIHDCAVAKVATAKCIPPNTRGDVFDRIGKDRFQVCDRYALSETPTAQEEDAAIAAAAKECTAEIEPKRKSAHEEIEEYKRQHGIKD